MRRIQTKTNVTAPNATYSFGAIKDNPGNGTGTPVDKDVYHDIHQAMELLLLLTGVAHNGLEESNVNSYQSALAWQNLGKFLYDFYHQVGTSFQPPYSGTFVGSSYITAIDGMRYTLDPKSNRVFFQGACERPTELNNSTVFTLPIGYRPQTERAVPIVMLNNGIFYPGVMKIATTGVVTFLCNAGDGSTTAVYIVEGVSFNIY